MININKESDFIHAMNKSIILIGLILVTGCIQQKNEISFSDLNEDLACISLHKTSGMYLHHIPEEFIINSQEEYKELLEYKSDSPACKDFVLPHIDFSENTLLGKYASGSGCSVKFEKHVYIDDANKKIIYSIKVIGEGDCEMMGMSMNWITIPTKIPPDYIVVFEVKN